jgi:drug/metabolite transporter (DMT)-like permease
MKSALFSKPLPIIALVIAHAIWGANFVVAKITLQEFPVYTLAFLRFALASLMLAPFFWAENTKHLPPGKKFKIDKKHLPILVGIGVFMVTLNITFFFMGIERTTATTASTLTLVIPMISVLFGWWFLKEKIFTVNLLGLALGLAGAVTIIGLPQLFIGNVPTEALMGNLFIFFASLSFVIGALLSRKMLKIYPSMIITAVAFLVGVVTFFPMAIYEYLADPSWPYKVTVLGILGLLYMTLLASISAYFLFEWGLAKTSLIGADLFQYSEPFIATSLAIAILGERISFSYVVGSALIALGVYWGTLGKEAHHRHHKPHRV